jgi:hypothetical protein
MAPCERGRGVAPWLGRRSRYGGGVAAGASSEADLTRGGVQPPSEAEPHPRGGLTLERGGPRPRGRPALERDGPHPRGCSTLERGGTSPEGATGPRARRSFVSAVLRPSSEAEFRPRVPGPIVLVGRWGHQGRDYVVLALGLRICLCLCFLQEKVGFPRLFRGPLWLSPTVAPENLRGYPLGSRRC